MASKPYFSKKCIAISPMLPPDTTTCEQQQQQQQQQQQKEGRSAQSNCKCMAISPMLPPDTTTCPAGGEHRADAGQSRLGCWYEPQRAYDNICSRRAGCYCRTGSTSACSTGRLCTVMRREGRGGRCSYDHVLDSAVLAVRSKDHQLLRTFAPVSAMALTYSSSFDSSLLQTRTCMPSALKPIPMPRHNNRGQHVNNCSAGLTVLLAQTTKCAAPAMPSATLPPSHSC